MSTPRHNASPAASIALIALIALPHVARATEDHFDLEGDTWGAPIASDSPSGPSTCSKALPDGWVSAASTSAT